MVTRDSPHLTTDISPCSNKKEISTTILVWYQFDVVSNNSHQTRVSSGNTLSITTTGNVFVARWVLPLVTRPVLNFVMIH